MSAVNLKVRALGALSGLWLNYEISAFKYAAKTCPEICSS